MKRTILCYIPILIVSTLLWSLVCVISKPLLLSGAANQQAFFKVESTNRIQDVRRPFDSTQGGKVMMGYEEALRGLGRIGSTPPRCEHKCGGCIPCNPTQKPTNKHLIGVQYANYEPEGWKCMCGTSYFNP